MLKYEDLPEESLAFWSVNDFFLAEINGEATTCEEVQGTPLLNVQGHVYHADPRAFELFGAIHKVIPSDLIPGIYERFNAATLDDRDCLLRILPFKENYKQLTWVNFKDTRSLLCLEAMFNGIKWDAYPDMALGKSFAEYVINVGETQGAKAKSYLPEDMLVKTRKFNVRFKQESTRPYDVFKYVILTYTVDSSGNFIKCPKIENIKR